MGLLYPLSFIPKEEYIRKVDELVYQTLLGRPEPGKPDKGIVWRLLDVKQVTVRMLRPRDLGLAQDNWSFTATAAGETTIVDHTLDDKTIIAIWGIYDRELDPKVTELIFGTGGGDVEDVYLEDLFVYESPVGILRRPIIYQPSSRAIIKAVFTAAATERLGFIGVVVEPAGRRIMTAEATAP